MSTTKPIVEGDENAAKDRFTSRVLEFGCAEPPEMAAAMLVSLRLHTDAWDLAEDLTRDETSILVCSTSGQRKPTRRRTFRGRVVSRIVR